LLGALVQANGNNNQPVNKKAVACGPVKLDITAGCSKYITYTIKYYGTRPIKCHFYYKVQPCEKLFKVKYPTSFILKPGKNTFKVLVSPDFYMKPRAYHFYGYFYLGKYTDVVPIPVPRYVSHKPLPHNQTVIPDLPTNNNPPIPEEPTPPNTIPEIVPPVIEIDSPQASTNWVFYGMLFMCIVIISFSLLFLTKKEERII
jgi:hypothetical protein